MSGIFPSGGVSASQALPTNLPEIETTGTNCSTLYHNARCNTKADPIALNAVIAEIGAAVNCAGLAYDCTRYDNLCSAIEEMSRKSLFECLDRDFPTSQNQCSVEYLVLGTDSEGCKRITRYSQASAELARVGNSSVWGTNKPYTELPENPGNEATYYNQESLWTAQQAGNVDMSRLQPNWIFHLEITLACASSVTLFCETNTVLNPTQNTNAGAASVLAYSVDGVFPTPSSLVVPFVVAWTNYQTNAQGQTTVNLSAGTHTLDFYVIGRAPGRQAAKIPIVGSSTTSQGTLVARISPL